MISITVHHHHHNHQAHKQAPLVDCNPPTEAPPIKMIQPHIEFGLGHKSHSQHTSTVGCRKMEEEIKNDENDNNSLPKPKSSSSSSSTASRFHSRSISLIINPDYNSGSSKESSSSSFSGSSSSSCDEKVEAHSKKLCRRKSLPRGKHNHLHRQQVVTRTKLHLELEQFNKQRRQLELTGERSSNGDKSSITANIEQKQPIEVGSLKRVTVEPESFKVEEQLSPTPMVSDQSFQRLRQTGILLRQISDDFFRSRRRTI